MNRRSMTLTFSLPRGMDDDTVLELWYFMNDLSDAFDSAYGQQVRRALQMRMPTPDPQQPWLPFDDDINDLTF